MTTATQPQSQLARIDDKINRDVAGATSISKDAGGLTFHNMSEVLEFAKLMAVSGIAVPPHLRCNPGACLAICIQSVEWRMSPYAVANKSYVVNDRVSYESQLIHAVIEQRAPIKGRLRNRYIGQGDSRQCIVWGYVEGEDQPFEFTSAEFGKITPKNSPLWKTKPDLQLYYNASRDWARMYFPDVIMGVYAQDEMDSISLGQPRPAISMPQPTHGLAPRDIMPSQPRAEDSPPTELEAADDQDGAPSPADVSAAQSEYVQIMQKIGTAKEINEVNALKKRGNEISQTDEDSFRVAQAADEAIERIKSTRGERSAATNHPARDATAASK